MKASRIHLEKLHAIVSDQFKSACGDRSLALLIAQFGSLIVEISEEFDKSQKRLEYLTWAIIGLTFILGVLATPPFLDSIGYNQAHEKNKNTEQREKDKPIVENPKP